MTIPYKKKYLNTHLILGVVLLILGLLNLNYNDENRWFDYGYLVIGLLYMVLYIYQKLVKYLSINHGVLKLHGDFGKKVVLADVKVIKTFAGDYILKTDDKTLTINTQIIDPLALKELQIALEALNVTWC
ncbi:MAG TPA: hypothetical protein PKC63_15615 [Mariniflexile sp.]|nr:hypothetical protein [Mariniflexile sp.]